MFGSKQHKALNPKPEQKFPMIDKYGFPISKDKVHFDKFANYLRSCEPKLGEQFAEAPLPVPALLTMFSNLAGRVSSDSEKQKKADEYKKEFLKLIKNAEKKYDAEENLEKKEIRKSEWIYLYTSYSYAQELIDTLGSKQTRWHSRIKEISDYYDAIINAKGLYSRLSQRFTWLGLAGGFGASELGFLNSVKSGLKSLVKNPDWHPSIDFGVDFGVPVGIGALGKWMSILEAKRQRRLNNQRDKEFDVYVNEEKLARWQMRKLFIHKLLSGCADYGYTDELIRMDAMKYYPYAGTKEQRAKLGDIEKIRKSEAKDILSKNKFEDIMGDVSNIEFDMPAYIDSLQASEKKNKKDGGDGDALNMPPVAKKGIGDKLKGMLGGIKKYVPGLKTVEVPHPSEKWGSDKEIVFAT